MRHSAWYTPAIYGILTIIVLQYSGADNWLASQIYDINHGWNWRDSWLLETVLHKAGRSFVAMWVVALLILTCLSFACQLFTKTQRIAILYALCATIFSVVLISGLKQITMLPCPWDVNGLGGSQSYVYLHQMFSSSDAGPQCYPAGHASGGYALFSLYFCLKLWRADKGQKINFYWLLPGMVVGGLFGVAQQLRGAHFLSHDLSTALLCWYCSFGLWLSFTRWFKLAPAQATSMERTNLPTFKTLNWLGK
ncbi:phosphatase PAP2 family protein [Flavobacterium sp. W21_SRS_FM6]|uniref:phosphatase PAP2 family protein n=1 Tax=Flavobacterium sp. W21_SRS_FM6 TaxID=3240268 RepID=UPI003F90F766